MPKATQRKIEYRLDIACTTKGTDVGTKRKNLLSKGKFC